MRLQSQAHELVEHGSLRHSESPESPLPPFALAAGRDHRREWAEEIEKSFETSVNKRAYVPPQEPTGTRASSIKLAATNKKINDALLYAETRGSIHNTHDSMNECMNSLHGLSLKEVATAGSRLLNQIKSSRSFKRHRLDDVIDRALDNATADGHRGRKHPGVKSWFAFCEGEMGVAAERPLDPLSPLLLKLEEETLAMRFVCALVEDRGLTPESARVYFSAVQGWHSKEFGIKLGGGLKLERLPAMLKGLRRLHGGSVRPIRKGFAPQLLRRAMDRLLDPANPLHANVRAALSTATQGLLRSAEFCGDQGKDTLRRSDIVALNQHELRVMVHQCKNTNRLHGKSHELLIGAGGTFIDAVAEMENLLKVDPAAGTAPLFRDPNTNKPLSYEYILSMTRQLAVAVGESPDLYGTHSFRIAGATALFNAGASDTVVRMMGRWSSDVYRIYLRACKEQCRAWSCTAGSTACSQLGFQFDEVDFY